MHHHGKTAFSVKGRATVPENPDFGSPMQVDIIER
jgi:hypothetical protein